MTTSGDGVYSQTVLEHLDSATRMQDRWCLAMGSAALVGLVVFNTVYGPVVHLWHAVFNFGFPVACIVTMHCSFMVWVYSVAVRAVAARDSAYYHARATADARAAGEAQAEAAADAERAGTSAATPMTSRWRLCRRVRTCLQRTGPMASGASSARRARVCRSGARAHARAPAAALRHRQRPACSPARRRPAVRRLRCLPCRLCTRRDPAQRRPWLRPRQRERRTRTTRSPRRMRTPRKARAARIPSVRRMSSPERPRTDSAEGRHRAGAVGLPSRCGC